MKPLPLLFRRIVSWVFFILFAISLVTVSIYATGYRLGDEFTLERTGGIHVGVPISGAIVYLEGEEVGTSSFLDRSFFIDNLPSGTYGVSAEKEGYRTWNKTLIVERALVTDTSAFLIPDSITPLPVVIGDDDTATSTREISRTDFLELSSFFEVATTTMTTTSVATRQPDPTELIIRDGNIYVRWNRSLDRAPSAFCIAPAACVVEISVELGESVVERAEFFEGGVVYQTPEGIYISEIDVKQPSIVATLYEAPDVQFRIVEGELIVLDGEELFIISW